MRTPKFLTPLMNRRTVLKQKNLLYVLCIILVLYYYLRTKDQILRGSSEDPMLGICARNSGFYTTLKKYFSLLPGINQTK